MMIMVFDFPREISKRCLSHQRRCCPVFAKAAVVTRAAALLLQLSCESLDGELSVMDEAAEDELLDDLLALANSRVASALG